MMKGGLTPKERERYAHILLGWPDTVKDIINRTPETKEPLQVTAFNYDPTTRELLQKMRRQD